MKLHVYHAAKVKEGDLSLPTMGGRAQQATQHAVSYLWCKTYCLSTWPYRIMQLFESMIQLNSDSDFT